MSLAPKMAKTALSAWRNTRATRRMGAGDCQRKRAQPGGAAAERRDGYEIVLLPSFGMRKLRALVERLGRKDSPLLREALDDLFRKYDLA